MDSPHKGVILQFSTLLFYVILSAFFCLCRSLGFDFSMFENNKSLPKDQFRRCFTVSLTSLDFLGIVKYKHDLCDTASADLCSRRSKIIS